MAIEELEEDELDLLSVFDEDGQEIIFEILDRYETEDEVYVALSEYVEEDEESDELREWTVFKVVDQDGNDMIEEIEDENEFEQVVDIITKRLNDAGWDIESEE